MRIIFVSLWLVSLSFADPAAQPPLHFMDAVKTIVDRSPDVGIQKTRLESTKATNLPTRMLWAPSLSLQAGRTHDDTRSTQTETTSFVGKSDLNLYHFGSDVAANRAASQEQQSQESLVKNSLIKSESDAVGGVVAAIQAEMELEVLRELVRMREHSVSIDEERFRKGLLALQEVEKVRVDLENARARYNDSQLDAVQARANLQALLGHTHIALEWPWKQKLTNGISPLTETSDSQLRARPDWQAAEQKVKASDLRASEGWGKIFPSLDLNLTYGYYDTYSDGTGTRGPSFTGGVTLTIPLFDRLANLSTYQVKVQQKAAAELELEKVRRLARSESTAGHSTLDISLDTARSRERNLETSRKLYQDNLKRFLQGMVTANDLIIDQERLFQSELFAIKGWAVVHTSVAKLCHAYGKRLEECWNDEGHVKLH